LTGSLYYRIPESGSRGQTARNNSGIPWGNPGRRRKEILLKW
jgi:hypothetical protein